MYLDYWKLKQHPFDRLSVPTNDNLARQPESSGRDEHPTRDNLLKEIDVYSSIDTFDSPRTMTDYIERRLEWAGLSGQHIFSKPAYDAIWKHSGEGMPHLVNLICKLALKAGQTNNVSIIDSNIVNDVAYRLESFSIPIRKEISQPKEQESKLKLNKYEREQLAEQIATEMTRDVSEVQDPFEKWDTIRKEVLDDLNHGHIPEQAIA
ncbi:hypothetical protein BVX97_04160 [bacterium E08(2017)]|nr:hypothetical protein BVX97_04160 [bacterium E08(2017)]